MSERAEGGRGTAASEGEAGGAAGLGAHVRRRRQGVCYDCGRGYGNEFGFPDLLVPNDVWRAIGPTGKDGGLLCPSCIVRRCALAGIECEAFWASGPFCQDHDPNWLRKQAAARNQAAASAGIRPPTGRPVDRPPPAKLRPWPLALLARIARSITPDSEENPTDPSTPTRKPGNDLAPDHAPNPSSRP